jgi:hypothetical protein
MSPDEKKEKDPLRNPVKSKNAPKEEKNIARKLKGILNEILEE